MWGWRLVISWDCPDLSEVLLYFSDASPCSTPSKDTNTGHALRLPVVLNHGKWSDKTVILLKRWNILGPLIMLYHTKCANGKIIKIHNYIFGSNGSFGLTVLVQNIFFFIKEQQFQIYALISVNNIYIISHILQFLPV